MVKAATPHATSDGTRILSMLRDVCVRITNTGTMHATRAGIPTAIHSIDSLQFAPSVTTVANSSVTNEIIVVGIVCKTISKTTTSTAYAATITGTFTSMPM